MSNLQNLSISCILENLEVIIIGSGPAGCAAAMTCMKAGLKVLIVTDEPEPDKISLIDPAPLESIHPGVSSLLKKIGAAGAEVAATHAHYSGIYAGNNYTPLGEDESGAWQGMHINRQEFNVEILDRVRNSGIIVQFNERVEDFISTETKDKGRRMKSSYDDDPALTSKVAGDQGSVTNDQGPKEHIDKVIGVRSGSKELYAKYIIDASGKNAIAGKKLNFKRQFFSPTLICWTGISECPKTFSFNQNAAHFIPVKNGWTWLAPQPSTLCAWTRLSVKGEKSLFPPDELKDCKTLGKIHFGNMRWRLYRPVCKEGIVLCGDAAGILDPAAGQGIFNALWSGMAAADKVVACLKEPDLEGFHLAVYDDWFVRQFEEKVAQLGNYYKENGITIS